jgi:hypothetical protein
MKKLSLLIVIIFAISTQSCKKDAVKVSGTVGVGIGPVYVSLSFGSGTGVYYGYGHIPNNVDVTVAYITSKPLNQTSIAVFDQSGHAMGTVTLSSGDWRQDNALFNSMQHWNYSHPAAVLVQWDSHWTTGPWTGKIIG